MKYLLLILFTSCAFETPTEADVQEAELVTHCDAERGLKDDLDYRYGLGVCTKITLGYDEYNCLKLLAAMPITSRTKDAFGWTTRIVGRYRKIETCAGGYQCWRVYYDETCTCASALAPVSCVRTAP